MRGIALLATAAVALLGCAGGDSGQTLDPAQRDALAEIRALQYQATCETEPRPEGEPYWTLWTQSDGSERLELVGQNFYMTTDWPADFRPSGAEDVRCRTASLANVVARIFDTHGVEWSKIEVQAVQTAGLAEGQVRVWGRQEKTPERNDFVEWR